MSTKTVTVQVGDNVMLRQAAYPFCSGTAARVVKVGPHGCLSLRFPVSDLVMVVPAEGTRPLPMCTHCGQGLTIRPRTHWYESGTWVAADDTEVCGAAHERHPGIGESQSHRPADSAPHRA